MPPRLEDTEHAMVIPRKTRCFMRGCMRWASYDVSMPERWQDGQKSGTMGDWMPMCYGCAKAATEGKIRR